MGDEQELVEGPRCDDCGGRGRFDHENGYNTIECEACEGKGVSLKQIGDLLATMLLALRTLNTQIATTTREARDANKRIRTR